MAREVLRGGACILLAFIDRNGKSSTSVSLIRLHHAIAHTHTHVRCRKRSGPDIDLEMLVEAHAEKGSEPTEYFSIFIQTESGAVYVENTCVNVRLEIVGLIYKSGLRCPNRLSDVIFTWLICSILKPECGRQSSRWTARISIQERRIT